MEWYFKCWKIGSPLISFQQFPGSSTLSDEASILSDGASTLSDGSSTLSDGAQDVWRKAGKHSALGVDHLGVDNVGGGEGGGGGEESGAGRRAFRLRLSR